jgi:hypothetical protein
MISILPAVPMNEPVLVPDIETSSDARDVETVRMLDRRLVCIVFHHRRVEDALAVIDEMYAVSGHQGPEVIFRSASRRISAASELYASLLTSSPTLCQKAALSRSPCRAQLRARVAMSLTASSPYWRSITRAISRASSSSMRRL